MSDNEGWIPHDGGKIPCDGKLAVDVKFQNGIVDTHGAPAAYWLWERDSQIGYDIVFWRPHKNADGQAGYEYQKPSQESYAAGPACSAPDEALIDEIADAACSRWIKDALMLFKPAAEWAIREYIRRSAGKEKG